MLILSTNALKLVFVLKRKQTGNKITSVPSFVPQLGQSNFFCKPIQMIASYLCNVYFLNSGLHSGLLADVLISVWLNTLTGTLPCWQYS